MRCLVVDDELLARERLIRLLGDCDGVEVCGEAESGEQALNVAQAQLPDLVLLDIRMPGMDGLEAARHLLALEQPPSVVFTTAFGDHALEAFETQAVDYLLKPIHPERLQQALDKARRLSSAQLEKVSAAQSDRQRSCLCARVRGNLELIEISTVIFLQADNKYVTVCAPGRQILIEESLKSLEQEFADLFIRVHRNALVASAAIRGLEKSTDGQCRVILEGTDERLEVSRRLLSAVRKHIKAGTA